MHKTLKSIISGLEKPIKQYGQEMDGGKHELTDKDPERLFHLMGAMAFGKLLCLLEEMKEDGEKMGKSTVGGLMSMLGKFTGGNKGGHSGMNMHYGDSGMPVIPGFTGDHYGEHMPIHDRRGVPGSGRHTSNYDNGWEHPDQGNMDEEMRRHRSPRTGRFVRGEADGEMEDRHEGNENRGTVGPENRRR